MDYWDEAEADDLRAQDRENRRYQRQLARHPHCQDPDHPGCECCEEEEGEEE